MCQSQPRLSARALAHSLLLFATCAWLPACEPEECSANFDLSGAIEWVWVWRHPSTTCEVRRFGSLDDEPQLEFINDGGDSLLVTLDDGALAVGTYTATVIYAEDSYASTWTNLGTPTTCLANILDYEVVDWVREDRHRIRGTLVCGGELVNPANGSELTLSEVVFSIYVPDTFGLSL